MKRIFISSLVLPGLALIAAPIAFAAEVRLESYTIERQALRAPRMAVDAGGERRAFSEVHVVRLKGNFPVHGAVPAQLFIGDHPIREYGATQDGVYFKVYDPDVLKQWNGKPFRYAIKPGELRDSGLVFRSDVPSK